MKVLQGFKNIKKFVDITYSAAAFSSRFGEYVYRLISKEVSNLTTNQIEYAKARETGRHNLVNETIERGKAESAASQARSAERQALVAELSQRELERHNKEGERVNWFSALSGIEETKRAHQESERISWFQSETDREAKQRQAAVQERQASVAEHQLSINRDLARAQATQAAAAWQKAQSDLWNAETNRSALAESIRHSMVVESEAQRHNVASELVQGLQADAAGKRATASARDAATRAKELAIKAKQAETSARFADVSEQRKGFQNFSDAAGGISDLAKSFSLIWEAIQ